MYDTAKINEVLIYLTISSVVHEDEVPEVSYIASNAAKANEVIPTGPSEPVSK